MAGLFGTGLFVLTLYFLRVLLPPRSVIVLELFLSIAGMTAVRFAPRLAGCTGRSCHARGAATSSAP